MVKSPAARWMLSLVQLCLLAGAPPVVSGMQAASYDRLYVFGDSYSDMGAGYLDGDGPTAVVYLAERLRIPFVPSNDPQRKGKSLNFAVSGAGTGSGSGRQVENALLGLGMRNQVDDFAQRVHSREIVFPPATTLFFLAGGLNDKRLPSAITVDNLQNEIRTLYRLGARHFLVALLPVTIPAFSEVGRRLNPELANIPPALRREFPDVRIGLSRWGLFFDEVMKSPAQYGIQNTTDACAGRAIFHENPTRCATPSAHFYYHAGHPSTAVHKAVGQKLYEEVIGQPTEKKREK